MKSVKGLRLSQKVEETVIRYSNHPLQIVYRGVFLPPASVQQMLKVS